MMPAGRRRGGGGGVVDGGVDPRNLHLKKELTQIRKAARLLKDPGTSSSWRSPIGSARSLSLTKHHYVNHLTNGQVDGNAMPSFSENLLQIPLEEETNDNFSNSNVAIDRDDSNAKENERKVFLCNWRGQKSDGESRQIGENGDENGSSSTLEDSLDGDSLAGVRNGGGNDSKSDTCLSDIYASAICRFKGANFTPSIRRAIKKKTRRRRNNSSESSRDYKEKLRVQELLSRYGRNAVDDSPSVSLGRDDLMSLVDQSDGTEDCFNSGDLGRTSTLSPLLARLKSKGWTPSPAKLLRRHRKDDGSVSYSTPGLSTGSYKRFAIRNPSTVESWDATTGSFNDGDDDMEDQLDFPGRQGCGIPCYWSRRSTPKSRNGSSCSPSLSDTLRRKGSIILCGSHAVYQKRHYRSSAIKKRLGSKTAAQSLIPLLTNSAHKGGSSTVSGNSEDEVSSNLGELDLEALSRLDGRRWSSSCRSREGLELIALNGEVAEEGSPENMRSLSHKYRPMFFEELIGQNIVVQSLRSALSRRKIAPVYLFHGPRGTGKTSAARIFAAALNCLAGEETKPCGICRECTDFISGKSSCLGEVDGSNKKGVDKIKYYLKSISTSHASAIPQYKVFIVEECHLLPSKTWLALLRLLEKPMPRVVFILITTDFDNMPRAMLSRCQKHLFNKISNGDIVNRLRKISVAEKFDIESSALELIASNANGSLRDAETMLDQLSLFGKRVTKSLVNELMGVVSDEKLLELLELAMSSNAAKTVIKARLLMDSGVDPIVLMSQLVNLIVDIIAGSHPSVDAHHSDSFFGGRSLTDRELERLKHALTILSQAEKHLAVSSDRSTWFTATLLQLGSVASPNEIHATQSLRATEEDYISMPREAISHNQRRTGARSGSPNSFPVAAHPDSFGKGNPLSLSDAVRLSFNSRINKGEEFNLSNDDSRSGRTALRCIDSAVLNDIWIQCIEKCHSKTLRQLLCSYGKLISISEIKGVLVAHIAFGDSTIKSRAEGFLSSITNSFEIVIQRNVEVKMILRQDSFCQKLMDENSMNLGNKAMGVNAAGDSDPAIRQDQFKESRGCFNVSESHQTQSSEITEKDNKSDIPLRRIESIIHEQRLETAWLQAMEKGTPGSMSHLRPERNQVLPQDGVDNLNRLETVNSLDMPSQHWEDELNHEISALRVTDEMRRDQKDQTVKRLNHYPISPSLLHSSSMVTNFTNDNMGYESGSGSGGCGGMFCWNTRSKRRGKGTELSRGRGKGKGKGERFSEWFRGCA